MVDAQSIEVLQGLKTVGSLGIAVFVIRELLKIVWYFVKQKKADPENQIKETSRERIKNTNDTITELKPVIYETRNKAKAIDDIVGAKNDGIPVVYNRGLKDSIVALNAAIVVLSTAVESDRRSNGG